MQILVPLFIEGGTLIELDDPDWTIERWTVFFVYGKLRTSQDPTTKLELPIQLRNGHTPQ